MPGAVPRLDIGFDLPQQVGMRALVGVHDFRMATKQQLFHLDGSLLGVAPSAVGIDFRWKVGFANNLAAFPASRVC